MGRRDEHRSRYATRRAAKKSVDPRQVFAVIRKIEWQGTQEALVGYPAVVTANLNATNRRDAQGSRLSQQAGNLCFALLFLQRAGAIYQRSAGTQQGNGMTEEFRLQKAQFLDVPRALET